MSFPKGITFAALQNFAGSTIVQNSQLYSHFQDNSTGNETSYFTPVEMVFRILIGAGIVEGTVTASGAAAPTGVGDGHVWLARAVSASPPAVSTVEELHQWDAAANEWVDIYDTPRPDLTAAMFQRLMNLPSGGNNCGSADDILAGLPVDDASTDGYVTGDVVRSGGLVHTSLTGSVGSENYVDPNPALAAYAANWSNVTEEEYVAANTVDVCATIAAILQWTGETGSATLAGILAACSACNSVESIEVPAGVNGFDVALTDDKIQKFCFHNVFSDASGGVEVRVMALSGGVPVTGAYKHGNGAPDTTDYGEPFNTNPIHGHNSGCLMIIRRDDNALQILSSEISVNDSVVGASGPARSTPTNVRTPVPSSNIDGIRIYVTAGAFQNAVYTEPRGVV